MRLLLRVIFVDEPSDAETLFLLNLEAVVAGFFGFDLKRKSRSDAEEKIMSIGRLEA